MEQACLQRKRQHFHLLLRYLTSFEKCVIYQIKIDTEGSNSVEKSATHDAKIFALAMLMSSYFIYNSVGAIDENSINDLSLTTQLSKNIAVAADESSEHTLSYYTPKFLWALRDFTLELQDARGQHINANQYLENALTDQVIIFSEVFIITLNKEYIWKE